MGNGVEARPLTETLLELIDLHHKRVSMCRRLEFAGFDEEHTGEVARLDGDDGEIGHLVQRLCDVTRPEQRPSCLREVERQLGSKLLAEVG